MRRPIFRARTAAARFVRRKAPASRWIPARLRWARRGDPARIGAPARHTVQVHSHSFHRSWVTKLNLHFHLAAFFRESGSRMATARRGSPGIAVPSHSRGLSATRGSPVPRLHAVTRVPHSKVSATAGSPRAELRQSSRAFRSPLKSQMAITTAVSQREGDRAFGPAAKAAQRSTRVQQVPSVRTLSRRPVRRALRLLEVASGRAAERAFASTPRELPPQTGRSARASASSFAVASSVVTARTARTSKGSTSAVAAWMSRSPVALVWRSPSDKTASSSHSANTRRTQSSAAPPPQMPAAPRASEQAVVRAAALEPGLAERLADDVIRRIDRRARIERERKGM
jgi:hypothetical protein